MSPTPEPTNVISSQRIRSVCLTLGVCFVVVTFGAGWYASVSSQAALAPGFSHGWLRLFANNLTVVLTVASGLVSGTLMTVLYGSLSLYVTGGSFGAAVAENGLVQVVAASPHIPFEMAALVVASAVGLSPLPLTWAIVSRKGIPSRQVLTRLALVSVVGSVALLVVAALIEVGISQSLANARAT